MCGVAEATPSPHPKVINIQKQIVQPAEFRLKYAKNALTCIHVCKNVCLNGIYFTLKQCMHAYFVVAVVVVVLCYFYLSIIAACQVQRDLNKYFSSLLCVIIIS